MKNVRSTPGNNAGNLLLKLLSTNRLNSNLLDIVNEKTSRLQLYHENYTTKSLNMYSKAFERPFRCKILSHILLETCRKMKLAKEFDVFKCSRMCSRLMENFLSGVV